MSDCFQVRQLVSWHVAVLMIDESPTQRLVGTAKMRIFSRQIGQILILAGVLVITGGACARSTVDEQPETGNDEQKQLEQSQEIVGLEDTDYPEVVAEVGDREITGVRLAQRIMMIEANAEITGQSAEGGPEQVALDTLIREELLHLYARDHDLVIGDEEAAEIAQREYEMLADQDSSAAREALQILADQHDIHPDEYPTHPEVIESYRTIASNGQARTHIIEAAGLSEVEDPEQASQAIDDALEPYQAEVRVYVDLD